MLRERWIETRNRLLASPSFQRWAARFPLTRPVARMRAARLFDLTAGFVYSQILAACVELDLIERMAAGPIRAEAIDLPPEAAHRVLTAAHGLGLVEPLGDGRWALGPEGAALRGNPGVAEMVRHHRLLYADLADPLAMLRSKGGGALAAHWAYGAGDAAPYSALMAASQPMVARQVLDAYAFSKHRRLLDVGGGSGAFLSAVTVRHPGLALTLFDLPDVVAHAALPEGAARVGGSFKTDSLPTGHDLVTLIRILHDHDDSIALQLLRSIHAALPPGGTLLIAEPMAGTRFARGVGSYFEFYLWAMGSGRPRSASEIRAMLAEAGFAAIREHRTALPLIARVLTARHH